MVMAMLLVGLAAAPMAGKLRMAQVAPAIIAPLISRATWFWDLMATFLFPIIPTLGFANGIVVVMLSAGLVAALMAGRPDSVQLLVMVINHLGELKALLLINLEICMWEMTELIG